jgi:hypothetical protein
VALLLDSGNDAVGPVRRRLEESPEALGILPVVVSPEVAAHSPVPSDTRLVVADYSGVPSQSRQSVVEWLKRALERVRQSPPVAKGSSPPTAPILVRADRADQTQLRTALGEWETLYLALVPSANQLLLEVARWLRDRFPLAEWLDRNTVTREQIETLLRDLVSGAPLGAAAPVRWQPLVSHACARLDRWKSAPHVGPLLQAQLQDIKDEILWNSRHGTEAKADLVWTAEQTLATVLAVFAARSGASLEGGNFLARARERFAPSATGPILVAFRSGILQALLIVAFARLVERAPTVGAGTEPLVGLRVVSSQQVALDLFAADADLFNPAAEAELRLRVYRDELNERNAEKSDTITIPSPFMMGSPSITSQPARPHVSFYFSVLDPPA